MSKDVVILPIKQLSAGMVVKNYKEMCKILNEPVLGGNSKKSQQKNWQMFFSFEKKKQTYIINEIYDEAKIKKDKRRTAKSGKYLKLVETILLKYIMRQKEHEVILSLSEIYTLLGIDTSSLYFDKDETDDYNNEKLKYTFFMNKVNKKINRIVRCALSSMQKRLIISYESFYAIERKCKNKPNTLKRATEEELKYLTHVECNILRRLKCNSKSDVVDFGLYPKFKKSMDKQVKFEKGWESVCWAYKIKYLSDKKNEQELMTDDTLIKADTVNQLLKLNYEVYNSLYLQIDKHIEEYNKFKDCTKTTRFDDIILFNDIGEYRDNQEEFIRMYRLSESRAKEISDIVDKERNYKITIFVD